MKNIRKGSLSMNSKKVKFAFIACLWVLLFLSGLIQADDTQEKTSSHKSGIGVSIKFYGGGSYLSGGDINEHLMGINNRWNDLSFIDFKGPEPKYMHMGFNLGGEAIINVSPRLGIGFGAGYMQASKVNKLKSIWYGIYQYEDTHNPKMSVIPLTLSMYCYLPMGKRINFAVIAGAGYYLGKFNWNYDWVMSEGVSSYEEMWKGKSNALGFHGGLGLEFNFSSRIAFVIEGIGRYAKLSRLKGEFTSELKTGEVIADTVKDSVLWYYDYHVYFTNKEYPTLHIGRDKPSGSEYKNVREGEINLSGFSIRAGIRIKIK